MSFKRVELAPGYSIAPIINGCWQLSPDHGAGPGTSKDVLRIFADLADQGFTTFDCADIYPGVEEALGKFRRSLCGPDRIQIHTKYVPDKDTLREMTGAAVDAAVDRSLRRLGVERLDLLQFHWWDYATPGLEMLVERLTRAQRAGKIRLLGATNFNTTMLRRMTDAGAVIVSLQGQYSLVDRRPESQMAAYAVESGVRVLPYGVLAGGFLSNKYLGSAPPSAMNRSLQKYRLIIDEIGGWGALQNLLAVLAGIASRRNTTIGSIAARWVLDQPGITAIILGIGSKSRATQNVSIANSKLDEEDRQRITAYLESQAIPPGDMYDLERDTAGPHAAIIKTNLHDAGGTG